MVAKKKTEKKIKSVTKQRAVVRKKVVAKKDVAAKKNLQKKIKPGIEGLVKREDIRWSFADLVKDVVYMGRDTPTIDISGLCLDSREVKAGDLFFACEGERAHGKNFIDAAIDNGASIVMWESKFVKQDLRQGIPVFGIPDLKMKIGVIAERFYGYPSKQEFIVGVTGTNGKTSVSQFIAQAMSKDGKCGVVGTLGNGMYGHLIAGMYTTPDAISLHALLADIRREGAEKVVMEVSSHALDQGRVEGVAFDVAVFTNLSHEHLDYHGNMLNYGLAKRRLFESKTLKYAVINIDDEYGRALLVSMPGSVGTVSYGFKSKDLLPSLLGSDLQLDQSGLRMKIESDWGKGELYVPLLGEFNAQNLLAALGALLASGIGFDDALQRLSLVQPVSGRMEGYGGDGEHPLVVVDYAHTPHALEQALTALRRHTAGKLFCVFGCGGDRDRSKRPMMAKIAEQLADYVVVTDDNPRTEASDLIISDVLAGFSNVNNVRVNSNRATAIAHVVANAAGGDVVLVAGKGHENYQIVGNDRLPFSDADQVKMALAARRIEN